MDYDKLNPREVILKAYESSKKDGKVRYVRTNSSGTSFKVTDDQPPPTNSHWRVHPDGKLEAHTEAWVGATEHKYEECNRQDGE